MASLPDNRGFDYFLPGGAPLEAVAGNSTSVGMDYFLPGGEPLDVLVEVAAAPASGGPFPWFFDDMSGGFQTLGMGTV